MVSFLPLSQVASCPAGALKGFGFATFTTRGHAESAIKTTNGKVGVATAMFLTFAAL